MLETQIAMAALSFDCPFVRGFTLAATCLIHLQKRFAFEFLVFIYL
jgi:hypothetical protein